MELRRGPDQVSPENGHLSLRLRKDYKSAKRTGREGSREGVSSWLPKSRKILCGLCIHVEMLASVISWLVDGDFSLVQYADQPGGQNCHCMFLASNLVAFIIVVLSLDAVLIHCWLGKRTVQYGKGEVEYLCTPSAYRCRDQSRM